MQVSLESTVFKVRGQKVSEKKVKDMSFEEALTALEEITRNLEGGRIKLDEAVAAYTKGMELKNICEAKLSEAKLKIEQISLDAAEGIKVCTSDIEIPH